jgi:hypothetical protein
VVANRIGFAHRRSEHRAAHPRRSDQRLRAPAVFEVRNDWPSGDVEWYEVVVLGMR